MNGRSWPNDAQYITQLEADKVRLLAENHQIKGEWYRARAKLRDAQGLLQKGMQFLAFPNTDLMKLKDEIRDFLALTKINQNCPIVRPFRGHIADTFPVNANYSGPTPPPPRP